MMQIETEAEDWVKAKEKKRKMSVVDDDDDDGDDGYKWCRTI